MHEFASLRSFFSSLKCNLSENSIQYFRNLELSPCLSSLSHLFYHLRRSTICTRPLPRTKWIQMVRVPRTSHFRSQSIRMSTSVNPKRMFAQSILFGFTLVDNYQDITRQVAEPGNNLIGLNVSK